LAILNSVEGKQETVMGLACPEQAVSLAIKPHTIHRRTRRFRLGVELKLAKLRDR